MKKFVAACLVSAMVLASSFAEISISAEGTGIVSPIGSNGDETYLWIGTNDSGAAGGLSRIGLSIAGESDYAGFVVDIHGEDVTKGDNAYVWGKPIDQIQIMLGRIQETTGRGNACWGLWNWIRQSEATIIFGEDFTYTQTTVEGFCLKVTPIENLWILACVDVKNGKLPWMSYTDNDNTRYGAGYDIPDVGSARVQVLMRNGQFRTKASEKKTDDVYSYAVINPAFDLTGIENLFVTVGAYIPTQTGIVNSDNEQKDPLQINAAATINVEAMELHFAVGSKIGVINKSKSEEDGEIVCDKVGFVFGAGLDYDFGNSVKLVSDFRYATQYYISATEKNDVITGLVGIEKAFSNGSVGVGFEAGGNIGVPCYASKVESGTFTWSVPVKVSIAF